MSDAETKANQRANDTFSRWLIGVWHPYSVIVRYSTFYCQEEMTNLNASIKRRIGRDLEPARAAIVGASLANDIQDRLWCSTKLVKHGRREAGHAQRERGVTKDRRARSATFPV